MNSFRKRPYGAKQRTAALADRAGTTCLGERERH